MKNLGYAVEARFRLPAVIRVCSLFLFPLELVTFVSSCEGYVHLFSLSIQRLRGAVGRELLFYTEGPWFVSQCW